MSIRQGTVHFAALVVGLTAALSLSAVVEKKKKREACMMASWLLKTCADVTSVDEIVNSDFGFFLFFFSLYFA
jgi:hypothetical protein